MAKYFVIDDKSKTGKALVEIIHQAMKIDKKSVKESSSDILDREMALGIGPALTDEELEELTEELEKDEVITLEQAKKEAFKYFRKKKANVSHYKKAG